MGRRTEIIIIGGTAINMADLAPVPRKAGATTGTPPKTVLTGAKNGS